MTRVICLHDKGNMLANRRGLKINYCLLLLLIAIAYCSCFLPSRPFFVGQLAHPKTGFEGASKIHFGEEGPSPKKGVYGLEGGRVLPFWGGTADPPQNSI